MPALLNQQQNKNRKSAVVYVVIVGAIVLLSLGFLLGRFSVGAKAIGGSSLLMNEKNLPDIFQSSLIEMVWGGLKSDYLKRDQMDIQKMYYGAIRGFVAAAGDPYTMFMDPDMTKEFYDDVSAQFEGIGAEIGIRDGRLTVVTPMPDSPAEKAGLKTGDKIYAIDKIDTTDMPVEKAVKLIRGTKGTTVTLLVLRGEELPKEYVITRDVIQIKSVEWKLRDDGILQISLHDFYSDTGKLFEQMNKEMKGKNIKGIILDLRGDPGGLLNQANEISSYWVKDGQPVLLEVYGDGKVNKYYADGSALFAKYKTVVLIDGGSASASEIVAGALKDYGLATLVGEKSFGKGSVQEIQRLPDGSSLKITVAEWQTPKGNSINEKGIVPDVEVKYTQADFDAKRDPQLDKAVEIIKQ